MTPERYMHIRALADRLIASCDGGADDVGTIEDLSVEECKLLDSFAFCCESCDQWSDINDQREGTWTCKDCK